MAFGVDCWIFLGGVSGSQITLSGRCKPCSAIVCECAGAWIFVDIIQMVDDGCVGGGLDYCCDEDVRSCQSNRSTGLVVFYSGGDFNGSGNYNGTAASGLERVLLCCFVASNFIPKTFVQIIKHKLCQNFQRSNRNSRRRAAGEYPCK